MRLIGIAGSGRRTKEVLAEYLVQAYGFERFTITDPAQAAHLLGQRDDRRALVVPDVKSESEAQFVRRRGLLIHLRRPQALAEAQPSEDKKIERQVDDVRLADRGCDQDLFARVDELLVMIARWGMYGGQASQGEGVY